MTFTIQEVPNWDIYESGMYDLTLPELLSGDHMSNFLEPVEIKVEENYLPLDQQPTIPLSRHLIGSPSMNMPVLGQAYNPFSPVQAPVIQSLASPSNTFINSPSNTYINSPEPSNYSASPINSPQTSYPSEDFLQYGLRQAMMSRQHMYSPMVAQNAGYYYNDFAGKRRKRDDELTPQEYEKRRLRRERNKQAALRCRTRRRERIDALEQETNEIEEDNKKVENEIVSLRKQLDDLKKNLKNHKCEKQVNLNDTSLKFDCDVLKK